jgi:hypothetical protein
VLCPLKQSVQNEMPQSREDAGKSASALKKKFLYRSFVEVRCIVQ